MSAHAAAAWAAALTLAAGLLALTAPGAAGARRELDQRLTRLESLLGQAARLRELERGLPSWARRSAPIAGLAQRVTSALAATGIDPATLGSLAPEARAAGRAGSAEFVRHQATLNLTGVTLPQVGLFLAAWREREPDWTVVSIDLRPLPTAAAPPGGDLPLQAVLRLESISLEARSPP